MVDSVLSILAGVGPADLSGGRSSNRFEYQKNIILREILLRFTNGQDFIVLIEHFEDFAVIDPSSLPIHTDFFQVKSAKGSAWTLSALLELPAPAAPASQALKKKPAKKPAKKQPPNLVMGQSILGKLFASRVRFAGHPITMRVVSNAPFKVALSDGMPSSECDDICLDRLAISDATRITKQLQVEHNLATPPNLGEIFLAVCDLGLQHPGAATVGLVVEALTKLGLAEVHPVPLHRALIDEIRRRTDQEFQVNSAADLFAKRGISKAFVQDAFKVASLSLSRTSWSVVEARLHSENMIPRDIVKIKNGFTRFQVRRTDPSDPVARSISSQLRALLARSAGRSLLALMAEAVAHVDRVQIPSTLFSDDDIRGALLVEYYD